MLHEVTEAYTGGQISQRKGVSSSAALQPGSVYERAHAGAVRQSGIINVGYYNGSTWIPGNPSGDIPSGTKNVVYTVTDKKGIPYIVNSF